LADEAERSARHVAIIMDGNGRWAERRGLSRIEGHREGLEAVRDVVRAAGDLGIEVLTLYAFSLENWNRPQAEVTELMRLLEHYLEAELPEVLENDIQVRRCARSGASTGCRPACASASTPPSRRRAAGAR
jgi:undecaprenyl diphosphate synthase